MSGYFYLDWATLAISLFNTILLIWLALTVLLNAQRPTWGVSLAGAGLLVGAAFFISHSAILGQDVAAFTSGINFWWHLGWGPVVAAPFAWYMLMLWYSGFWDGTGSVLFRRQLPGFMLTLLLSLLLLGLLFFANPLPSLTNLAEFDFTALPAIGGTPLLMVAFPVYILVCIGLALDTLLHPAPSGRLMGDQARQRARPWLVGATMVMVAVSLLVGWVLLWVVSSARLKPSLNDLVGLMSAPLAWFDLLIDALVGAAVFLLGQAIVSYEIFTGRVLPRRGFRRQWRNAVLMAACISLVVSWSLKLLLRPIYTALLVLIVVSILYALASWRTHTEREASMRQLRPFIASQKLYEQLLAGSPSSEINLLTPFTALCKDVLSTQKALLLPQGPLAALVSLPLAYPDQTTFPPAGVLENLPQSPTPHTLSLPLDPRQADGWALAIPLWSERGPIGKLILGEKNDGGLYTQEEIEIARASGERLVDLLASIELAQRLMELQRERLAESRVLDQRTRRLLHDDVLPRLHTILLGLSTAPGNAAQSAAGEIVEQLTDLHRQISDLLRELPAASAPELARQGLIAALRQVIDFELSGAFDEVDWQTAPAMEQYLPKIPPLNTEVIFYAAREALRNAARHARPANRRLCLKVEIQWQEGLVICIEDDGIGIGIIQPPSNGGGHGLALHSTMMAVVGGSLALESLPGQFTRVILTLPL